jgi:hypothetical protein
MAIFSAGVVLTATVLMAIAGNNPTLTTGFRLGCLVMNSAIGGLTQIVENLYSGCGCCGLGWIYEFITV